MTPPKEELLARLRATFVVEAQEQLQLMSSGLLALEHDAPAPAERVGLVERTFRAAHSLKGAARAVEDRAIESACETLEERLAVWKRDPDRISAQELEHALRELDGVSILVTGAVQTRAAAGPHQPAATPVSNLPGTESGLTTVRVHVQALEQRLIEAEEMLATKQAAARRVDELRELADCWHALQAEFNPAQALGKLREQIAAIIGTAEQDAIRTGRLVDDLLSSSKKLLMLPFATISVGWEKLVHDLARENGSKAELVIEGGHVEIDKRILEVIKDPLVHLLRNCIAHGVEPPGVRERQGKSGRSCIRVSVRQLAGTEVQVRVADDGAGIDADKIRAAACRLGLITAPEAQALSDVEARMLVFRSGLSTSAVTGLAGRGLGLAIVQEHARELGGRVTLRSQPGRGTDIEIVVPTLRASFRGVLVRCAAGLLVLPTTAVDRIARVRAADMGQVEGVPTLAMDGRPVPLASLAQVLGAQAVAPADGMPVVVLGRDDQRTCFLVDEVLQEQELLVKPFMPPLQRVRNVAAAALLPSGQKALVLNVPDLLRSARRQAWTPARETAEASHPEVRTVLVAEDSITSRMLIRSALESAGYRVVTAVDGVDAWSRLRTQAFDLVVSDVEMPRLDGFELTARIRADERLSPIPVVLVTALEKREDLERGLDVGASAYIPKSSFDQSRLVDTVHRLI